MKAIQTLSDISNRQTRIMTIYEILGRIGSNLSGENTAYLHKMAEEGQEEVDKALKKLKNSL